MTTLSIPQRWEDISPAWINAAIAARHPDARVERVEILKRDDGTNRRVLLGLSYAAGRGPRTLFLKSNDPAHREVHLRNGNLFNEADLFASATPLPVDHPVVYQAIADREQGSSLLVMEDLMQRDADPRDATRPMSAQQVADGVRGLARLHARYWNFSAEMHPALGWVKTWEAGEGWKVGLRKRIPIGLERAARLLPRAVSSHGSERILDFWCRYVDSLGRGPTTLLHGDAHIGNTYVLPGDRVGFLDWQVVRRGEWSQDVGYFIAGALTEADRREHEKSLLAEYRDALELPASQRPGAAQIWNRYRASQAYGLAIWLSTLGTDGWQAPTVSQALVQRYANAFVELDSAAVLDE